MGSLAQPQAAPLQANAVVWPPALRLAFRFAFSYFVLYASPEKGRVSILLWIPGLSYVREAYIRAWHALFPWLAIHVFHLAGERTTYFPTGSGDTTLDYIQNLVYVVVALAAALVWSALDRNRKAYRTLHEWLRILVRYTLALTMLSYGFAKVFPMQFQPPGFGRLIEPHGEFSPMGVLWSFMGASLAYTMFAGASEVLGGALLLFRRTTTVGAMFSAAVLANVVALNFCYDVPVKLYSSNLLVMALFLLIPDFGRLAKVLVLNRPAAPADLGSVPFRRRRLRQAALAMKVLFLGYALYTQIEGGWSGYLETYTAPGRPPLYGLYQVEKFQRNGQEVQPLLTEIARWRYVAFERSGAVSVRRMNDSTSFYPAAFERGGNTVLLGPGKDPFTYSRLDADHVTLQGTLSGEHLALTLLRVDTSKFRLVSRGFHWISERPFNR